MSSSAWMMRRDYLITVTNTVNNNVDLFRFYGRDAQIRHQLQAMAKEDCPDCRPSDLQVEETDNKYKQYQLVVPCDGGTVIYTATLFEAVAYL